VRDCCGLKSKKMVCNCCIPAGQAPSTTVCHLQRCTATSGFVTKMVCNNSGNKRMNSTKLMQPYSFNHEVAALRAATASSSKHTTCMCYLLQREMGCKSYLSGLTRSCSTMTISKRLTKGAESPVFDSTDLLLSYMLIGFIAASTEVRALSFVTSPACTQSSLYNSKLKILQHVSVKAMQIEDLAGKCCMCSPKPEFNVIIQVMLGRQNKRQDCRKGTFAIDIVCCSMASSSALCSLDGTSPNSSMQHTPPSASGMAPACRVHCWPTLTAAAVRPACDVPLPVVATDLQMMPA
jgi:hypothetical protein